MDKYIGKKYLIKLNATGADPTTGENIDIRKNNIIKVIGIDKSLYICELIESEYFGGRCFKADWGWLSYNEIIDTKPEVTQTCFCATYDLLHFGHEPECLAAPKPKPRYRY